MTTTFSQRSFAGGEIAPALYARVDTAKYASGARQLRNVQVMRHGGAQNRSGTSFVIETKFPGKKVRLIPFVFNQEQTYVLEFGEGYIRVHRDGDTIKRAAQGLSGITNANPAVLTYVGADSYSNGATVEVTGVVGAIAPFVNGRRFLVAGVDTVANTFELQELDGTPVDSTAWGVYGSGGSVREIYEVATPVGFSVPYLEADLPALNFVQSADVLTLAHPNHPPCELRRLADDDWLFFPLETRPLTNAPSGITVTAGGAGSQTYKYRVTAVSEAGEESLLGASITTASITGITQANPAVVTTSAPHSFFNGEEVLLSGIVGMTALNNRRFLITRLSTTTFELVGMNSTALPAYVSGGTVTGTARTISAAAVASVATPHVVSWTAPPPSPGGRVSHYKIYQARSNEGNFGLVGVSYGTSYNDIGAVPDMLQSPPSLREPFDGVGRYPQAVGYYGERLVFGGALNTPETVEASRVGAYRDFRRSVPIQDDDAITFQVTGQQVNRVKHILDVGVLGIFTSGGEHVCFGQDGVLLPTAINRKEQSDYGISNLRPLKVGKTVLFIQQVGSIVRDFLFDFQVDGYNGNDLTVFSSHLFDGYEITDWTYARTPHSIVWCVRDDGVLLGLTYVREQQILAWHRHDTDGFVEQVCAVPEGQESRLYVVVRRSVDGKLVRYLERMNSRRITKETIKDAILMDSAISFDGRHTGSTTMTLSGGSTWAYDETLTLTASAGTFSSGDVGNDIQLFLGKQVIRFRVTGFTSATVVTGKPHKTVPVAMRNVALAAWARAVDELSGLWHLEGKTVAVFADGFVVGSPNNPSYTPLVVQNGQLTLERPYAVIHVGLPYLADLELLDIDSDQGETLTDKKKWVGRVTLSLEASRGMWVGPKPPAEGAAATSGLFEMKLRENESYEEPVSLITDNRDVNIRAEWNSNGRVFIRQIDPLPLTILAVALSAMVARR